LVVETGFEKSKKKPSQVYASLIKKDKVRNLSQNKYALYDSANDMYYINIDVENDIDHYNGEYELSIHVADINGLSADKWSLGLINLWFK
jgi:hypothetical protein